MSLTSYPSIFTKSNLFYIPLSITIAHTLNFVVNSPLSTWKEFPPKLPSSVYSSIYFAPLLLFISLTFEPIQTRTRFYILLSLALIYTSVPIIFREMYSPLLQNTFAGFGSIFGLKMILFLKFNRAYLNQDQKKEFKSYLWSLFNWRFGSYIIHPKSENSNEIIKSPTTSQVNKKLMNLFTIIIVKRLICELAFYISTKNTSEIPEKAYQIRLLEFITKGIAPITTSLMLKYMNFMILVYLSLSLNYDVMTIIVTIFYRLLFLAKYNDKPILLHSGILTLPEYISLKEWCVTFLFNTKHFFSEPWMASSPRNFWSDRWQLMFSEIFKELGFLPVRNLLIPFVPRKIANMMGVLGALGVSALFHEYMIIGQFNLWTGEHLFFFMIHGVIFILWEAAFGYENKNENAKVKRLLKWILMATIYLSVLPAFIEPLSGMEIPSYFAKYYNN